jgi:two-component system, OmpR family, response regulator
MPPRCLKRILVIDDDPDLLAVVSLALTALGGFDVLTCASSRDALDMAEREDPDLILLDIMMPDVDGFGVLRALREGEATVAIPIVMMSAAVRPQDTPGYQAHGCIGLVAKPFDPAALPQKLESLWGAHVERRQDAHRREFERLRRAYLGELAEKLRAMDEAAASLVSGGWDRARLEALYHVVHRMAGSSGLYRLPALSRAAGALEAIVKRYLSAPVWPPAALPASLTMLVQAVEQAARSEGGMPGAASLPGRERDGTRVVV